MAGVGAKKHYQEPMALAMVICDSLHRDPATGKYTLLRLFSVIGASSFPVTHPQLALYVALTDGRGTVPIKIRLIDVDEELEPLFEAESEMAFDDPRAIIETGV